MKDVHTKCDTESLVIKILQAHQNATTKNDAICLYSTPHSSSGGKANISTAITMYIERHYC